MPLFGTKLASLVRTIAAASCAASVLVTTPASAQRPGADVVDLKFASFFTQPVGPRGLSISDGLRAADGRRVRLVGYMVAQEQPLAGQFMLTPRPVQMSEHADGEADDLPPSTVTVLLDPRQRDRLVPHHSGLISLTGRLSVGRAEDALGRVSWVRLQLEPESVADAGAAPAVPHAAGHRH